MREKAPYCISQAIWGQGPGKERWFTGLGATLGTPARLRSTAPGGCRLFEDQPPVETSMRTCPVLRRLDTQHGDFSLRGASRAGSPHLTPKGQKVETRKWGENKTKTLPNSTNVPSHPSPPASVLRGDSTILLCFSHQKTQSSKTQACHRGPMPLGPSLLQNRRTITLFLFFPHKA